MAEKNKSNSGRTDAVARVYAGSLYELASADGGPYRAGEIAEELEEIVRLSESDERLEGFLNSRIIPVKQKRDTIDKIFGGRASDLLVRFLKVVNDKERLAHLPEISRALTHLHWEASGKIEVELTTATEIEGEELERMTARIRDALGSDPVLTLKTDARMIGGMRLRVGDQLIDASLATRLAKIRESLSQSGMATIRSKFAQLVDETA